MKNKVLLFIVFFSLGIIVTYPAFVPSYVLDGYCTVHNGYNDTINLLIQNGRVVSAGTFLLFSTLHLPYHSMDFVSLFIANIFLALAVETLFISIKNKINKDSMAVNFVLLICVFCIFYNPLTTEVLLLNDVIVVALGILFITMASTKINNGGFKNYVLALLFMFLGILCYYGVACYLIPLIILLQICDKSNTIDTLKKLCNGFVIYMISFLIVYFVASFFGHLSKYISFDIISNLYYTITNLIPSSLASLFNFSNIVVYYLIVTFILCLIIYYITKFSEKKRNVLILSLLLLFTLIMPFIPNLFITDRIDYTAARTTLTIMIIPSILVIYILSLFNSNISLLTIVTIFTLGFNSFFIHQNLILDFDRYKEDIAYIKKIDQRISWYESENHKKIKTVYYAYDKSPKYYYSNIENTANVRLSAIDWALDCAFPTYTDNKYTFKKMNSTDYNYYFNGQEYNKFSEKQLKFEGDTLYLLIY